MEWLLEVCAENFLLKCGTWRIHSYIYVGASFLLYSVLVYNAHGCIFSVASEQGLVSHDSLVQVCLFHVYLTCIFLCLVYSSGIIKIAQTSEPFTHGRGSSGGGRGSGTPRESIRNIFCQLDILNVVSNPIQEYSPVIVFIINLYLSKSPAIYLFNFCPALPSPIRGSQDGGHKSYTNEKIQRS